MRTLIATLIATLSLFGSVAGAAVPEPRTDDEKTLYALGVVISRNLAQFNLTKSEFEMVQAGLQDGMAKKPPKVDVQTYGPKVQQLQQTRMAANAEREKQASKAFLSKAAAEKGATKTASGLVYVPITVGQGASPKATDTVKVHYQGALMNGTVFDSSIQRGKPASFALNQVVKCWTEGLQLMKVGGKAKLVCPSDIAYGDAGAGAVIPPGATLVFEVELLEIVKQ